MHQPIASLNLSLCDNNENKKEIKKKGLLYVDDVTNERLIASNEWKQAREIPVWSNAYSLLLNERKRSKISTTIKELDEALNGGLDAGKIYEFCSEDGVIKTQMCFTIAVNYLTKAENDEKEILYISTNDNFSAERIRDLIRSSAEYNGQSEDERDLFLNSILDRIQVIELVNIEEFVGIIKYLNVLTSKRKIALVIIDNIFIPFKLVNYEDKCRLLYRCFADLQKSAADKGFPILVTNNYTTRGASSGYDEELTYLGENYFHRINFRIAFSKLDANVYKASVLKSNSCDKLKIVFNLK